MLQLVARPDRAHDAVRGMRVGAEEQMADFVRDRETEHDDSVRPRLPGEPFDPVDVDGRELAVVRGRIDQRIPQLQLPAGGR